MEKPKVIVKNVSKEYSLLKSNKDKLLDFFTNKHEKKSFFAVKNINFTVYPGETIGIIGINGSGKSTLSNLLAQVIPPTTGEIHLDGEPSLIAISVGLNGQLSGLENIKLKCMMHGMATKEIEEVLPEVIKFADIGSFIEQPVKNYSSGMKSRLGFAISVHTDPDILVVDEALSVGDQTFYEKCLKKIHEFKENGKTIFFISHSAAQMRKISDRVMWIHYGEMHEFGDTNKVLNSYKDFVGWFNNLSEQEKQEYKEKMFNQQKKAEKNDEELSYMKEQSKKKQRKENRQFLIRVIMLKVILLFFMALIITGTSITSAKDKLFESFKWNQEAVEQIDIETDKTENKTSIPIDRTGIALQKVEVYEEEDLETVVGNLEIFDSIHVSNQFNEDVYKIASEKVEGYVLKDSIDIDYSKSDRDIEFENILPYLSVEFKEAYHYYLSFLNRPIKEVEKVLYGMESTMIEGGRSKLVSIDGEIKYYGDESDVARYMEVKISQYLPDDLQGELKRGRPSSNDELFYVPGLKYNYILNLKYDKLVIEINS